MSEYSIGLDYGTNSVRGLLVDVRTGEEIASSVFDYPHGEAGILLDPRDPHVARQHPQDYLDGAVAVIAGVLQQAAERHLGARLVRCGLPGLTFLEVLKPPSVGMRKNGTEPASFAKVSQVRTLTSITPRLANVGTIDPEGNGTFPHLSCSGVLPFLASLTVAGAAPDSHRLPVSSLG